MRHAVSFGEFHGASRERRNFLGKNKLFRVTSDAMSSKNAHSLGVSFVVCNDHPAFAGSDVFYRMKAEDSEVRYRPDHFSFVNSAQSVASVGHQMKVMAVRDVTQGIPIAGLAGIVHADDGLGVWRDFGFHLFGVEE